MLVRPVRGELFIPEVTDDGKRHLSPNEYSDVIGSRQEHPNGMDRTGIRMWCVVMRVDVLGWSSV